MDHTITIEINALRVYAHHGVLEQERVVGNEFEVTAHLYYPASKAVDDDDLDGTLNYAEAVAVIESVMAEPSQLLEHVCGRLQKALMSRFPAIQGGMLRVAKPAPPISGVQLGSVAVVLRW